MTIKKEIVKTLLLCIVYQIVFLAGHMIIHNTVHWQMQSLISFGFTAFMFVSLVCVIKPKRILAMCIVASEIVFYLMMICIFDQSGYFLIFRVAEGSGIMLNFSIYMDALIVVAFKLIYQSIIFVLCAVVFAIIKRIKKSKSTEKPEPNQE